MSEWDRRELCPDGGCVGVIGKDGKCNVCGKAGTGEASGLRPRASGADEEEDEHEHEHEHDQEPEQASGQSPKPKDQSPVGDEWDQRALCSDGACIGVIEDGKCNVCGKAPA